MVKVSEPELRRGVNGYGRKIRLNNKPVFWSNDYRPNRNQNNRLGSLVLTDVMNGWDEWEHGFFCWDVQQLSFKYLAQIGTWDKITRDRALKQLRSIN